jgi:hypothetical protein
MVTVAKVVARAVVDDVANLLHGVPSFYPQILHTPRVRVAPSGPKYLHPIDREWRRGQSSANQAPPANCLFRRNCRENLKVVAPNVAPNGFLPISPAAAAIASCAEQGPL